MTTQLYRLILNLHIHQNQRTDLHLVSLQSSCPATMYQDSRPRSSQSHRIRHHTPRPTLVGLIIGRSLTSSLALRLSLLLLPNFQIVPVAHTDHSQPLQYIKEDRAILDWEPYHVEGLLQGNRMDTRVSEVSMLDPEVDRTDAMVWWKKWALKNAFGYGTVIISARWCS